MKKISVLLLTVLIAFATGCGGKKDNEQIDLLDTKDLIEKSEEISKDIDKAQAKIEARKKKGDTIAVDWEVLNQTIPDIPGYVRSEPQGMKMTFDNQTYSTASANFTKDNIEIEVTLFDYNFAVSLFAGVTTWKTMGLSIQSSEGTQKVSQFDEIRDSWMFEEYNKNDKRATVTVSLNDRYWMQVAANEQNNLDLVKSVARDIAHNGKSLFGK